MKHKEHKRGERWPMGKWTCKLVAFRKNPGNAGVVLYENNGNIFLRRTAKMCKELEQKYQ